MKVLQYNYLELKRTPQAYNYHYLSKGDMEVILPLHTAYKEDFVNVLNGMFALALYEAGYGIDCILSVPTGAVASPTEQPEVSRKYQYVLDALERLRVKSEYYDAVLILQPTCPLRNYEDLVLAKKMVH